MPAKTKLVTCKIETVGEQGHVDHDDNTLRKRIYGPTYVPYKEHGQKILLPQSTDMSHKDNLKQLYNLQPVGMCNGQYKSLPQGTLDTETFSILMKQVQNTYLYKGFM